MTRDKLSSDIYNYLHSRADFYINNAKDIDRVEHLKSLAHYQHDFQLEDCYTKKYNGINNQEDGERANISLMHGQLNNDVAVGFEIFDLIRSGFSNVEGFDDDKTKELIFCYWLNKYARKYSNNFEI